MQTATSMAPGSTTPNTVAALPIRISRPPNSMEAQLAGIAYPHGRLARGNSWERAIGSSPTPVTEARLQRTDLLRMLVPTPATWAARQQTELVRIPV